MSDSMDIQQNWAWEDWVDMVLGVWLAMSPWILGFADSDVSATRNALFIGIAVAVLSGSTFLIYNAVEEWLDLILGIWLIVSPWVLSSSGNSALTLDFIVVGAVVAGLSGYEIWSSRHGHPHPD